MTAAGFGFRVQATDGNARAGVIETPHGVVDTPAFMPVATQGSVKGVTPGELRELGAGIILGNTYHLYLRPGIEVIEAVGGLHEFMGWKGPILTDSGGFQAFSLRAMAKLTDEAVFFRSHLDGSLHRFTPEAAVAYQERLGGGRDDVPGPVRGCGWFRDCRSGSHGADAPLGGTVPYGVEEWSPGVVWHCAGRDFEGYAAGVGGVHHRLGLSGLRRWRAGGGGDEG